METVAEDTVPSATATGLASSETELSALTELVVTVPATALVLAVLLAVLASGAKVVSALSVAAAAV